MYEYDTTAQAERAAGPGGAGAVRGTSQGNKVFLPNTGNPAIDAGIAAHEGGHALDNISGTKTDHFDLYKAQDDVYQSLLKQGIGHPDIVQEIDRRYMEDPEKFRQYLKDNEPEARERRAREEAERQRFESERERREREERERRWKEIEERLEKMERPPSRQPPPRPTPPPASGEPGFETF